MHSHPFAATLLAREHQRRLIREAQASHLRKHLRSGRRSP
jgi:hypothetical protein